MTRPNRMSAAVAKLASVFSTDAGVTVSYTAGTTVLAGLTATPSRTPYEVMDGQALTTYESRDYIIAAADLAGIEPAQGHRITEADGTAYQVAAPAGMNVYERIGPTASVYRIHTKGPV